MCFSSIQKLYKTIKNGSLLDEKLDDFSNEDLKLFHPFLTLAVSSFFLHSDLPEYVNFFFFFKTKYCYKNKFFLGFFKKASFRNSKKRNNSFIFKN